MYKRAQYDVNMKVVVLGSSRMLMEISINPVRLFE